MPATRMTPISSATVNVVAGRMRARLLVQVTTCECPLLSSATGPARRRMGKAALHP